MPSDLVRAMRLRDHWVGGSITRLAGVYDGIGARLAEEAGFDGLWASGLGISAAAGLVDANIISSEEVIRAAATINRATTLPVICDCDTGFGSPAAAEHAACRLLELGISGMCIEDQRFPKRNSLIAADQTLEHPMAFATMVAGIKQRTGNQFILFARTEALICGASVDEAISRADLYAHAGAAVLLIHSRASAPIEMFATAKRCHSSWPLACLPTSYPDVTERELLANGIRIVIYANHGLRATVAALSRAFRAIAASGTASTVESEIVPIHEVMRLTRMDQFLADEAQRRAYIRDFARIHDTDD